MFIHGEYNIVQMSIVLKLFTYLWLTSHEQMSGSPVYTRHQGRHWVRTEKRTHLKIRFRKEPPYCQSWDVPEAATRLRFLLASYWMFLEKWELWCQANSLKFPEEKVPGLLRSQERHLCEFCMIPLPTKQRERATTRTLPLSLF